MDYYAVAECRDASEILEKTSKLGLGSDRHSELGFEYHFHLEKVETIREIQRRRTIYRMLVYFLDEGEFLNRLKHRGPKSGRSRWQMRNR